MRYNSEQPTKVSKCNKDIVEFISKNIDKINSTGLEIVFILIDEDDTDTLKKLEKRGVSMLPALMGKNINKPIQKTDKIKKFLLSSSSNKKPLPVKNGDEELTDYQWDILDMGDEVEDNDGRRNNAEIQARVEYENKRREKRGQSRDKPLSASEIVAQQMRGRNKPSNHRRSKTPESDEESDDEDDNRRRSKSSKNRGKKSGKNRNMDPDPVDIIADMPVRDQEEAMDNNLSTMFWSGRGVGVGD